MSNDASRANDAVAATLAAAMLIGRQMRDSREAEGLFYEIRAELDRDGKTPG